MYDARRYRYNAAECLMAAYDPRQPDYHKLNFSMAALWLALAAADEAVGNLVASWDTANPTKPVGIRRPKQSLWLAKSGIVVSDADAGCRLTLATSDKPVG